MKSPIIASRKKWKLVVFFCAVCVLFGVLYALGEAVTPVLFKEPQSRFFTILWTFIVRFSLGISATGLILAVISAYERR